MGEGFVDLLRYEGMHISMNALTFACLTPLGRWLSDFIIWFPKQDVHYFVLILLFAYSMSYDKRFFGLQPEYLTQVIRMSTNLILIGVSTLVFQMLCQNKLQVTTGKDPEEATQNLNCIGGFIGSMFISLIFRIFTLSFIRSVMIGIQMIINVYYDLGAL